MTGPFVLIITAIATTMFLIVIHQMVMYLKTGDRYESALSFFMLKRRHG